MAAPTVQAVGTFQAATTTALTVTLPAHLPGDVIILDGISAAAMAAPSAAGGQTWLSAPNGSIGASGAFTDIYYVVAGLTTEPNPTYAAAANHIGVLPVVIRGADPLNPFNTSAQRGENTVFGAPPVNRVATGAAITTTVADVLVLMHMGTPQDTTLGAIAVATTPVNADLSSLAIQWNAGTTNGNGSNGAVVSGVKAAAGSVTGTVSESNTSSQFRYNHVTLALQPPSGGSSYTLTAAQGSFALSGQTATLKASRKLLSAQGSFILTGQAATLTYTPAGGSYTLTAASGSFALSGQAAVLKASRKLVSAVGSFAFTGQAAGFKASRNIAAAQGSLSLAGQSVNLHVSRKIGAGQGSFSLSGQAAGLRVSRKLSLDAGAFVLTGQDAGLVYTPAANTYTLTADAGSFSLSGQTAGLRAFRKLTAARGAFSFTGQDASLTVVQSPIVAIENRLFAPRIKRVLRSPDVVRRLDAPGISRRHFSAEIARSLQAPAIKRKLYS